MKGAQIAGQTAKKMQSAEKIGVIIGLDPAAIGFDYFETQERLSEADADYVQVIHTDITKFGMAPPMGHGLLLSVILWQYLQNKNDFQIDKLHFFQFITF